MLRRILDGPHKDWSQLVLQTAKIWSAPVRDVYTNGQDTKINRVSRKQYTHDVNIVNNILLKVINRDKRFPFNSLAKISDLAISLAPFGQASKDEGSRKTHQSHKLMYKWCTGMLAMSCILMGGKLFPETNEKLYSIDAELIKSLIVQTFSDPLKLHVKPYKNIFIENLERIKNQHLVENSSAPSILSIDETPSPTSSIHETSSKVDEACRHLQETMDDCTGTLLNSFALQMKTTGADEKRFELFLLASKYNNATALFNVGLSYEFGTGVKRDYKKAVEYYQQAADLNNTKALYNLAALYYEGKGVAKNHNFGLSLMKKAADLGCTKASKFVATQQKKQEKINEVPKDCSVDAQQKSSKKHQVSGNILQPEKNHSRSSSFHEQFGVEDGYPFIDSPLYSSKRNQMLPLPIVR